ncbi:MAG: GspE/PulE family protein [Gammaproteobacteria bacterium]|nr:MAG: GspE/PulE family protein [Gammaproteobacteria bacterium]
MAIQRIRLGDLLVQKGLITKAQLEAALEEQKKTGRKLGATLIQMGLVSEHRLLSLLSDQLKVPFIDLSNFEIDPDSVRRLPETLARRHRVLVLGKKDDGYLLGMVDPTDLYALDEVRERLGVPVYPAIIREADWLAVVEQVYRRSDEIDSLAGELDSVLAASDLEMALAQTEVGDAIENAPVVRLLKTLFEDAVAAQASDIHIEPEEKVLRIRQRIDGVLQEQVLDEKRIAPALVLRLKIMAGLDISEKRLPQDGRFAIRVAQHEVDVRIATMPVTHGEAVVMRLLDQSRGMMTLEELGMPEKIEHRFRQLVRSPHGLVLVTGPTGSGKTTTLYAALRLLNSPTRKIITAEDPVEFRIERVNQVQVNPKVGLTFSNILRAALRSDPDVILIGEMRDQETAEIGLRAAMTGHLVLSTLHTNDAVTTAMRLIDMGVEPYLVASALRGVMAQRLVRRICQACKTEYALDENDRAWLEARFPELLDRPFYHGRGCHHCHQTGYRGRIGIYEYLEMTPAIADALRRGNPAAFAEAASASELYRPLVESAISCALDGVTTLDEVYRVTEAPEER